MINTWLPSAVALVLTTSLVLGQDLEPEWTPLSHGGGHGEPSARLLTGSADHCVLHKVIMHQGPFPQYVQYKSHLPDLKEFTLCSWHKFFNHSTDHPIFSYTSRSKTSGFTSWVSNTIHSSFYQMSINGHTIYRINYPIRLGKWYHACQSWNGRTGEWQIWVNAERVGRGFYNLVVGKPIKGGGMAISGQDRKALGQGLMGEVTLIQLYKAALSAGKAYYNHKHHHAHKFHHEDMLGIDDPEYSNNLAGGSLPIMQPSPLFRGPGGAPGEGPKTEGILVGMQLVPRLPVEELAVKPGLNLLKAADILGPFSNVRLFKRDHSNSTKEGREKRDTGEKQIADDLKAEETKTVADEIETKDPKKRTTQESFGLIPGLDLSSFYGGPESAFLMSPVPYRGGSGGGAHARIPHSHDNYVEPAEWEVKSVMALCSACGEDPFKKANVLSWIETPKKLAAGALFVEANQQCGHF